MNTKTIIVLLIIFSALVLGGSYFFLSSSNNKSSVEVASYSVNDKQRPQAQVKSSSADLGEMKVSDTKSQDFTVKNVGEKPLRLSNISSSCGCTTGQIIIDGKESAEFGMHSGQSDYAAVVEPGKTAIVRLTYRPYQMPVYGKVEREVYVETNDPENSKLVFKAQAFVK